MAEERKNGYMPFPKGISTKWNTNSQTFWVPIISAVHDDIDASI